mmetsp:Transcript_862/g.1065  ORF Transcript_862/g.1065 Transcript_862/m.1065 type:complete len:280 (-) Transcript_862:613-1452(-)
MPNRKRFCSRSLQIFCICTSLWPSFLACAKSFSKFSFAFSHLSNVFLDSSFRLRNSSTATGLFCSIIDITLSIVWLYTGGFVNGARHNGQTNAVRSHLCMHSSQKECPQHRVVVFKNGSVQIEHVISLARSETISFSALLRSLSFSSFRVSMLVAVNGDCTSFPKPPLKAFMFIWRLQARVHIGFSSSSLDLSDLELEFTQAAVEVYLGDIDGRLIIVALSVLVLVAASELRSFSYVICVRGRFLLFVFIFISFVFSAIFIHEQVFWLMHACIWTWVST